MAHALVLNATYEPLCVVPLRRAVILVLAEKATILATGEETLHSERLDVPAPTVVLLSRYVRVPYRRGVPLSRRAVLQRDAHHCVYCDGRAETIDHVVPRSRGGRHVWSNVVAACRRCNHAKADRLLAEIGWSLPRQPKAPAGTVALLVGYVRRDPSWEPYLVPWAPAVGSVAS
ncbi:MAG: HNH endonuclease [Streptosporangiales bacterium]|nr:HNH endonuclease [Streptosporangiales bacterium]